MDEQMAEVLALVFFLGIGGGALWFMWMRGVFAHEVLERSPWRGGEMTLVDLLVGFGLYVIGMGIAGFVIAPIVRPAEGMTAADLSAGQMLVMMLATQAGMFPAAGYALIRLSQGVTTPRAAGPLRATAMGVMGLIAVTPVLLLVMGLTAQLSELFGKPPPDIAHDVLLLLIEEPWGPVKWGLILSAVIGAPIMEEIVFRGLMQTSLLQSGIIQRRWTAIVITSVLFAMIHLGAADPAALPMLYVLGLALGYVYQRTGNLLAPMAMHAAFNAIQITLAMNFHDALSS